MNSVKVLLKANQAVNKMNQFIGTVQRGAKEVQGDLTLIKNMLAGGILTDEGIVGGISEILANINDKTKLVLGSMTAGGIGLSAWGIGKVLSKTDEDSIESINQHFSQFNRMSLYTPNKDATSQR